MRLFVGQMAYQSLEPEELVRCTEWFLAAGMNVRMQQSR